MGISMPMHEDRCFPQVSFRQEDLPEILEWQVNGQYYILIKAEMTGIRNVRHMSMDEKNKIEADFQILSVRAIDDKPIDVKTIEKMAWDKAVADVKSGGL